MGLLSGIVAKIGTSLKRSGKNATQKTANETINKAFK